MRNGLTMLMRWIWRDEKVKQQTTRDNIPGDDYRLACCLDHYGNL